MKTLANCVKSICCFRYLKDFDMYQRMAMERERAERPKALKRARWVRVRIASRKCERGNKVWKKHYYKISGEQAMLDSMWGSGAFLTLDPGSQTHIFDSLMTNFWVKSIIILIVLAKKFFLPVLKLFSNFWYLWPQKMVGQTKFAPSVFGAVIGSWFAATHWLDQKICFYDRATHLYAESTQM